jgi:hypothetical protein
MYSMMATQDGYARTKKRVFFDLEIESQVSYHPDLVRDICGSSGLEHSRRLGEHDQNAGI